MKLTPIKVSSRFLSTAGMERVIKNTMDDVAEDIRIDLQVTAQTWKTRPQFLIKRGGNTERVIYTSNLIYKFINGGTRVRYATMSPDFQAKTAPRVIGSGAGRGGVLYINKRRPRPGIKAREFTQTVAEKWEKRIADIFAKNFRNEFK